MLCRFVRAAHVDGKRYEIGSVAEVDGELATRLAAAGYVVRHDAEVIESAAVEPRERAESPRKRKWNR